MSSCCVAINAAIAAVMVPIHATISSVVCEA